MSKKQSAGLPVYPSSVFTPESGAYMHISRHAPGPEPRFLHYHQHLELGLCISGRGIFYIRNQIYLFEQGDISIIFPGEHHIAQSSGSEWWFITVDVPALLGQYPDYEQLSRLTFGNTGQILRREDSRLIRPCLQRILSIDREHPTLSDGEKPQLGALISCILYETARWGKDSAVGDAAASVTEQAGAIYPAILYLLSHYAQPVETGQLCECCHMSPVHLRRIFAASMGISPISFLHRIRIGHACLALTGTGASVLSVAEQCGYTSLSSFNRQFLKIVGMSPTKYRSRFGKETVFG